MNNAIAIELNYTVNSMVIVEVPAGYDKSDIKEVHNKYGQVTLEMNDGKLYPQDKSLAGSWDAEEADMKRACEVAVFDTIQDDEGFYEANYAISLEVNV